MQNSHVEVYHEQNRNKDTKSNRLSQHRDKKKIPTKREFMMIDCLLLFLVCHVVIFLLLRNCFVPGKLVHSETVSEQKPCMVWKWGNTWYLLFSATPKARDIHKNENVTDRTSCLWQLFFCPTLVFVYFSFDNATTLFGCPVIWKEKKHVKLFSSPLLGFTCDTHSRNDASLLHNHNKSY